MRRWPVGLGLWLLVLTGAQAVALLWLWRFFVRTEHGQRLDTAALSGNSIGWSRIEELVSLVLNGVSVASVLVATAVVGFIGLVRRRVAVAFAAVLLIAGANLTTQLLKYALVRPELGVDVERAAAGNSLPSGHTTVAASVAVALVLVLPGRFRGAGAVVGAGFAALAGVATLSAGWHRPSDAVAALLVVGVWAGIAALVALTLQAGGGDVDYGPPSRAAVLLLAAAGVLLLAAAGLAMQLTGEVLDVPQEALGRRQLLVAYAGGATGIAGTAALVMAAVLATAHRVVPREVPPAGRETAPGAAAHAAAVAS